jgi:endo-1,4-beta-xylanase
MIAIEAEVIVEDNCGIASFVLDGVSSDEPDDDTGDGAFINDIQGVEAGTADVAFELRSERMQKGDGRVYTTTYTASDPSNNSATADAQVLVPPDMEED